MSTTTDRRTFLKLAVAAAAHLWGPAAHALGADNFRRIYRDPALRARFRPFLEHVFHLFPPDRFDALITEVAARRDDDADVYREVAERLPEIAPALGALRYGLPALNVQRTTMADQVFTLLGPTPAIDGYLEIGTTGRYVSELQRRVTVTGPIYLVNDVAPTHSVVDILERRALRTLGSFVPLGNYDPIGAPVAAASLDLVTNFIGLHHCPLDRLDGFVASIHRALKPGGRLLHRDHDVADPTLALVAGLAHDVFNVGVGLSWEDNRNQLRLFRSIADWSAAIERFGFRRTAPALAQDGDPTRNLLIEFVKA